MDRDTIRIGEVVSIDPVACTCRVVFDDDDSLNSYDLPVMQRCTYDNHDYQLPDIGEDVVVAFRRGGEEDGIVLGSFYAGEITPPESSPEKRTVVFKDGTRFSYDREAHELTMTIEGTEIVYNRRTGTITVPETITVNCTDAVVNASSSLTINSPTSTFTGDVIIQKTLSVTGLITGAGGFTVSGGSGVKATGNIELIGSMNASQDVVAGGISVMSHTHTAPHGETSGPH